MTNEPARDETSSTEPQPNGSAAPDGRGSSSPPLPDAISELPDAISELPASIGDQFDVAPSDTELAAEAFSPLNVEDRVVISLLFNEAIRVEHVERAWHRRHELAQEGTPVKLWRALAMDPSLDASMVYAEAANVFAFKTTQFAKDAVLACIRKVEDLFSSEQWSQMQALKVLPAAASEEQQDAPTRRAADRKRPGRGATEARPVGRWIFITHDPTNPEIHRFLNKLHLQSYDLQYAPEDLLAELTEESGVSENVVRNEYLEKVQESSEYAFDFGLEADDAPLVEDEELEAEINRSALINLFEAALFEGVRRGASDVHICPNEDGYISINFRVDGDLAQWYVEDKAPPEAFLAVAKDRSRNVDRFEREKGQDGFIQRTVDGTLIRYRVSVLPIAHSDQETRHESIVIRILDDSKVVDNLDKLGLGERGLQLFKEAIRQPHGMVILTGPTGSGKSTTLYAALHEVRSPKRNVLTVEDPVEYVLPGIRQIKVSHKLSVKEALRFILRHDPDVVMVGEMRDQDTAELGIKLANTGHLTFSTLHTNDAPSAVSRLYKMGVEPFLIAHSVTLVAAQRLLRVLCPACKQPDPDPDLETLRRMGFQPGEGETFLRAAPASGCKNCNGNGYRGRRAVAEVMAMTKPIRERIIQAEGNLDEDALRDAAVADGMTTLKDAAWAVVREGETSIEEMVRVVGVLH
ncbi:MAG: GspE/PulE family protein [Bacteroidota bacterium]